MKKTLTAFRKEMMEYAKEVVDLEPGETPKDWVDAYIDALKEDGKIVKDGKRTYVLD